MSNFQVKISGAWQDYSEEEQKILKRAFMAGYPHAKFNVRGQQYEYNFQRMVQKNLGTDKEREIRAPHKWQAPSKPIVPPGRTTCVKVPPGSMGTTIHVPHPDDARQSIAVRVPNSARPGQAMLVPVPPLGKGKGKGKGGGGHAPAAAPAGGAAAAPAAKARSGWSTGAKVAAGTAAVAGGAALGVGAVVAGESIAEHGLEATVDAAGDGIAGAADATGEALGDAFEHVVDGAEVAGDFIVDAADHIGDFVMDLF